MKEKINTCARCGRFQKILHTVMSFEVRYYCSEKVRLELMPEEVKRYMK